MVFMDELFSIQRLKTSFVFLLLSETILSISNGPSTIVEIIDWVGCK